MLAIFMILPALQTPAQENASPEPRDYVFVFITSGDATELSREEQQEAFGGHFSNMRRMAEAGDLLIAGPFGPPLAEPDHRGLFVLDAKTLEEGMELAETDPTYQAGVFKLTGHLYTTDEPLTKLHDMDMEAMEKLGENPPPGANARAYVLASAPYDADLSTKANQAEGVLIAGKLHGSGEDDSDRILLWLDAENEEAAKKITGDLGGAWTLHGWYGSRSVAGLGDTR